MANTSLMLGESYTPLLGQHNYGHFAFHGGRGTGKSSAVASALVVLASSRYERIVCGRQYMASIKDSSKELLEQKIYQLGMADGYKVLDTEIIHRSTGSRFSFIGLQVNPQNVKSIDACDIFWGEEAQNISGISLEIAIPTFRRKPKSYMIWTWNPVDQDDAVDAYFRADGAAPPKTYLRHVTHADNPWFYKTELPVEKAYCKKHNPKRYAHIWLGAYDKYSEARIFSNTRIGRVQVPDNCQPLFGMDFGFSVSPNALVKLYFIPQQRIIYVAAEAYGHATLEELPDFIDSVSQARQFNIVADCSRPETIQYLGSKGFIIRGSRKGAGSVKAGITWLQSWDIVIDPDCVHMQEEARKYYWKVDKIGNPLPITVPAYDHGWDAIRYSVEDLIANGSMTQENDDDGIIKFSTRRSMA